MILYHGTNLDFAEIDLKKSKPNKDFGQGFYLSREYAQAMDIAKGKCTMGWFYGFKLHLVINDKGEIIQWMLTPGNVDDREPLKDRDFTRKLFGKLFADRGYISQDLFEMLFVDDVHLVTKIRKNMKNSLMS